MFAKGNATPNQTDKDPEAIGDKYVAPTNVFALCAAHPPDIDHCVICATLIF